MRRILSFVAVLALLSLPAQAADAPAAAPIDAAGATTLKKQVEDSLQWRIDMAKAADNGVTLDSPIAVTPKDGYYEIELPKAALKLRSKGRLDIGTVLIKATPAGPGAWNFETTVPSTMTFYDPANAPSLKVTLGSQHITGTWLAEKDMYTKVDTTITGIKATGVGADGLTAALKTVKVFADLKDNGDNTWTGVVSYNAAGLEANVPGTTPVSFSVETLTSNASYDRLDMSQTFAMRDNVKKALKDGLPQDEKQRKALFNKLLAKPPLFSGAATATLGATGMKAQLKDKEHPQSFSLDSITFDGTTTSTGNDKARMLSHLAFKGLHSSFFAGPMAGLVPEDMNTEITIENLPLKALSEQLFGTLRTALDNPLTDKTAPPTEAQMKVKETVDNLPKLLQDAGSFLTIDNTYVNSRDLNTTVSGRLDAKTAAALGAAGKVIVSIKGVDETLKALQAEAAKASGDMSLMGPLVTLSTLQMKGEPGTAADGKSLRNYNFELKEDGSLLLNGVDMKSEAPPAATAPAAPLRKSAPTPAPAAPEPAAPARPEPAPPAP